MGLSRAVVEQAARQGGFVKRAQLLGMGMSSSAIDRAIRSESLTLVSPGVYRVYESSDHVDLMKGAQLALPGAVVSHQSAAHLLDFPQTPPWNPPSPALAIPPIGFPTSRFADLMT